jgi:Leucine-rich repeat (LRR) protein
MKKIYFLFIALCIFTSVNAQIINIPDTNFKAKLLAAGTGMSIARNLLGNYFKIDANNDGQIQQSEASQVSYLDVEVSNISSLVGILNFNNLQSLKCNNNQLLSLDVRGLSNLQLLDCNINQLTSLYVSGLTNLQSLICNNNQLLSLNVSGLTNLSTLNCFLNQLESLDVSGLTNLQQLFCYFNSISSLNMSGLENIQFLNCTYNRLVSLDVSGLVYLRVLSCSNNLLTSIFLKNGSNESSLDFSNNSNLKYICADDSQISDVQNKIIQYGYTNCTVNSYCSFVPGGTFYTINGNNKMDSNNNGCDALDIPASNLKFSISDGTFVGNMIANTTGNYIIPLQAGTHTITPVSENPSYFTISPTTVNVTFPAQVSPVTQNFCVTANGVHPDLEVAILPINRARPGFDATYKIIYKNKGNTTQSGTVNLAFNDAVLDLVLSNPVTTSQSTNNLSWDFANLLPFETREILVTLNLNSPLETPAVNAGYVLNYTTTITSPATDDLPNDNTFAFNQTVVNSFDPNDKTCLEGATITPTKVGDYVHYMIRFENNGTANAQNIVVKDMIDLAKFDINSIVPIKGSHSFVTNITAGNKVEFIFENINLPFDDANNDGFVAFKIKTKSTLVLGDTFTNNASIYFDYNFPIVTNTATTTIAALSVQDFVFSRYFSVYPNPVSDVLTISTKESIEVSSINIYNTLGQLVLVIPNAQNTKTVDVSSLTTGNYFIKINSDKGTSNTKFIKN